MVFNYAMNLQKQSDRSVPLFGAKFTFYVDEEMRNRLQVRLITRTLAFRVS